MLVGYLLVASALAFCLPFVSTTADEDKCLYDQDQKLFGVVSSTEIKLRELRKSFPALDDSRWMSIKNEVYAMLRNDEFTVPMLQSMISQRMTSNDQSHSPTSYLLNESYAWETYFPNKVYAWSLDLHAAPVGCNQAVYRDVGVVLHAENNHHPYCKYYGLCSTERLQVFSISRGEGFSLDPDHNVLKTNFYNHYQHSREFARIDTFVCSHPAANCEMFEKFMANSSKSMILYLTTRLEFGRDDMNINWRLRVAKRWGALAEKDMRYEEWIRFIWKYHKAGQLFLTANNVFDQQYVHYMTGLRPAYIPSWCGENDLSFTGDHWTGCELPGDGPYYQPSRDEIVFVPYKQKFWNGDGKLYDALRQGLIDGVTQWTQHRCNASHVHELRVVDCPQLRRPLHFEHGAGALTNHAPSLYKRFPALVMISYQTSIMTFFEFYRLNIPMFAPSLPFLVQLDVEHQVVNGRVYGWPKRFVTAIEEQTGAKVNPAYPPDPNLAYGHAGYKESATHWLQYSDVYQFPHVVLFDNWTHLALLTQTVNLTDISHKMWQFNKKQRLHILKKWDHVFAKAAPHRTRGAFVNDRFVPHA